MYEAEQEEGSEKTVKPRLAKKRYRPKQQKVVIVRSEEPKRSRCSICCCCGPCIGSCMKWLFLCGSLCFCALVIGMVYVKSTRSCCGGRADTCLTYASIRLPDDYSDFVSQFQGQQAVSMHKIGRALEICSTALYEEGRTNSCYRKLLECISDYANPMRHTTML